MKDPSFVAKHLHNAHRNIISPISLAIYRKRGNDDMISLLNLFEDDARGEFIFIVTEDLPLPRFPRERSMKHAEAYFCNGIVCLVSADNSNLMLCNPALRQFRLVRDSSSEFNDYKFGGLGFGYDSTRDDYMIVRIWTGNLDDRPDDMFAQLYSMRTDSWRKIELPKQARYVLALFDYEYRNGICYWILVLEDEKKMILSFDMRDHMFYCVDLPYEIGSQCQEYLDTKSVTSHMKLVAWKDNLTLFWYPDYSGLFPSYFEMWLMNDNGSQGSCSWIKHLTIEAVGEGIRTPLVFWNDHELLMESKDSKAVSYNLQTRKFKKLDVHGLHIYWSFHVKSLVSVVKEEEHEHEQEQA
ncbi:hypothetical protein UlMin_039709 [Ulmus minor]